MSDEDADLFDAKEIVAFIEERVTELALRYGPTHPWTNWPRFLYHLTDVTNAASILARGLLLSRTRAEAGGYATNDNASGRVISATAPWVLDSVRLYFRPRTPTFFHNEGIRPVGLRSPFDAHCPVPVAFLIDAASILARADTRVADGNLATRRARVGRGLEFLRKLPWEWIFHDGIPRGSAEQVPITFHRHAEVAIPGELPIADTLRVVGVRSSAEFETLRTLLSETGIPHADRWMNRVLVDSRARLFFQRWTFVEAVALDRATHTLRFTFNPHTETPAPFTARLEFVALDSMETFQDVREGFRTDRAERFQLPEALRSRPFRVRLTLDGCLAYANEFDPTAPDVLIRRD